MTPRRRSALVLGIAAALILAWYLLYTSLAAIAHWLTASIPGLDPATHLAAAVEFFLYEVPKVLMLLGIVIFIVGIIRTFFTAERTRRLLATRRRLPGNVLAAGLGVVTPFCSCSAIPLFLGFVESGVPLGITFSFLIAAPMVNEVAVVMLASLLGPWIAAIYIAAGLLIAIASGWIIGRLGMERHVEPWVYQIRAPLAGIEGTEPTWSERIAAGRSAVTDVLSRIWAYVVAGIAIGAGIHGFVPTGAMAAIMGADAWWSVPVAVALGVPMYSNAAGIIPIVDALLGKGAALGTTLAFMMSVIALSLPEIVILRKVLRPRLIAVFVGVVATGIVTVGLLFNALFGNQP